jgi:hypothetical protein
MDMSYQEKSIAGSLVAMLVVYGYYFAAVLRRAGEPQFGSSAMGRLIAAVVAIIVIEIAFHIGLALESKPEGKDERDILIESKAYRNAYFALNTGAFMVIGTVITVGLLRDTAPTHVIMTPFVIINLVLLFMVLAEIVKLVTQLLYYRCGVAR